MEWPLHVVVVWTDVQSILDDQLERQRAGVMEE